MMCDSKEVAQHQRVGAANPLRNLLTRLGLEHYEREIVRTIGAHLSRHRNFFDDPQNQGATKHVPVAAGEAPGGVEPFAAPDLPVEINTAARVAAIEASAYPLPEAAKMLGMDEDELEHRIDGGMLLAIQRDDCGWALPAFQFFNGKRIVGIARVLGEIREGAPLVLVEAFFTTRQRALRDGEGRIWPPREWLAAGGDLDAVRALARQL